jgi:hypothetical protein
MPYAYEPTPIKSLWETNRWADKWTNRWMDEQMDKWMDGQTDRWTDRQTDRQTTDRQTDTTVFLDSLGPMPIRMYKRD